MKEFKQSLTMELMQQLDRIAYEDDEIYRMLELRPDEKRRCYVKVSKASAKMNLMFISRLGRTPEKKDYERVNALNLSSSAKVVLLSDQEDNGVLCSSLTLLSETVTDRAFGLGYDVVCECQMKAVEALNSESSSTEEALDE